MIVKKIDEISTISNDDYISIVSTVTAALEDNFNCSSCVKKFPRQPERQKEHQKRLGCDGSVNPHLAYLPTHSMATYPKIKYSRCIGNFFSFKVMNYVRYLDKWRENVYPYGGSYYDQPNKFVEVMELIHNLVMQKQEEKEEKIKTYKR